MLLLAVSCTHTEEQGASQFFHAPRGEVWEVLVAVLKSYPLKTIDEQKGYIETETLGAELFWRAPHQKKLDKYIIFFFTCSTLRCNSIPAIFFSC